MKKSILFIGLLLFAVAMKSFSQPQWKFYIAYEDATGAKDTMWFIWDENANFFGLDTALGEKPLSLNYDEFNVYAFSNGGTTNDTLKTIANPYNVEFEQTVFAFNFELPIKISWDTSLLHASYLPPVPVGWVNEALLVNDYFWFVHNNPLLQDFDMTLTDSVICPDPNITDPWFWDPGRHFPMDVYLEQNPYTHITEPDKQNFKVFPNPASDVLHIQSSNSLYGFEVYDSFGNLVLTSKTNEKNITVDISNLNNGLYFIRIINHEKKIYYEKFIKNN